MCRLHDALFEIGAFVLNDNLEPEIVIPPSELGGAARLVLESTRTFSRPVSHVPAAEHVRRHRERIAGTRWDI
ncbi:hypothetical protein [Nitrospira sp. Ecomares 2.1]